VVLADQLPLKEAGKVFKYLSGKMFLRRFFFTQGNKMDRIKTVEKRLWVGFPG